VIAAGVQLHVSWASAITALTFWNLMQITQRSLSVWKTCCIARFPCDSRALVISVWRFEHFYICG